MSTLPVQAPRVSKFWSLPYTALLAAGDFLVKFADSVAEARRLAEEAHKRPPFIR
jgi:hypothetical protein